jgi:endogenous inhibitor of DNA gyrase (YacG/DUF329 family)
MVRVHPGSFSVSPTTSGPRPIRFREVCCSLGVDERMFSSYDGEGAEQPDAINSGRAAMDTVPFTDTTGAKRRGMNVACVVCEGYFVTRIDQPRKYCSKRCQYIGQQTRVILACAMCGKQFERKPSARVHSRSGLFFCNRVW